MTFCVFFTKKAWCEKNATRNISVDLLYSLMQGNYTAKIIRSPTWFFRNTLAKFRTFSIFSAPLSNFRTFQVLEKSKFKFRDFSGPVGMGTLWMWSNKERRPDHDYVQYWEWLRHSSKQCTATTDNRTDRINNTSWQIRGISGEVSHEFLRKFQLSKNAGFWLPDVRQRRLVLSQYTDQLEQPTSCLL